MSTAHVSPAEFKKRAAKHVPEADTQDAILQWLALMKVRAVRIDTAGQPVYGKGGAVAGLTTCAHVGTPDILVWLPWGQACAIEVKRAGQGKTGLRFSQARWILETARLSLMTVIIIAESLADVTATLAEPLAAWRNPQGNDIETDAVFFERYVLGPLIWRNVTAHAVELARRRLEKGPQ